VDEVRLRPSQLGAAIEIIIEADTDQMLAAPFDQPLDPFVRGTIGVDCPAAIS